jgi:hypothetical protein
MASESTLECVAARETLPVIFHGVAALLSFFRKKFFLPITSPFFPSSQEMDNAINYLHCSVNNGIASLYTQEQKGTTKKNMEP